MAAGPLQPRSMARTTRARMAGRGWTRPCRLRGSGTSARASIRERVMTGLRHGPGAVALFTHSLPLYQPQTRNGPKVFGGGRLECGEHRMRINLTDRDGREA